MEEWWDLWSVPVIAWAGLAVWSTVLILERDHLRDRSLLPVGVRDAALVGLLSATVGGSLSSLTFPGLISPHTGVVLSALWRAAVFVCGVYALYATSHDRLSQRKKTTAARARAIRKPTNRRPHMVRRHHRV